MFSFRNPVASWGCVIVGTHSAGAATAFAPLKPSGAIPTTVKAWPLSVIWRPTTAGSPPSRRCQKACDSTVTRLAPGTRSSSGRKPRPRAGLTPSTPKKSPDTISPKICSGSPFPENASGRPMWETNPVKASLPLR